MIPESTRLDQQTLTLLQEQDLLVQRYRALFALIDWTPVQRWQQQRDAHTTGPHPHPESAYLKAFFVKLCEEKRYQTQLRRFLVDHPLLVLDLGFHLHLDPTHLYGFAVERTVPSDRWLREKLRSLDPGLLHALLQASVHALQAEIPGLGEVVAVDVKHIYAWVCENNPRESITDRFCKDQQPTGDPDCRVGVKKSTNQEQPDGSKQECKEYLWGYGSGVVAATTPDYGDLVLAEHTLPFNHTDVEYYRPLHQQTVATLGFVPTHVAADAAFDCWYVYESCAQQHGIAHALRNEVVEELNTALVRGHRPERGSYVLDGAEAKGRRAEKREGRRNWKASRERGKRLRSEKRISLRGGNARGNSTGQAIAKPSEVAKRSGTPNSRIVTCPDVSGRALRANRCAHVRR